MKNYSKMKDSGVDWIGDIPKHWELYRLRFLVDITTGEKNTEDHEDNGEYPFFVRSQNVEKISTFSCNEEAVLTAGDGVGVGKVFHYINGKFDFHQRVYKMNNFRKILGKYFYYYFKENFSKEVFKGTAKSTVDSIRLHMIQNFPIVLGTVSEQESIIAFLEYNVVKIDSYLQKNQHLLELLYEKRQSTIYEIVTKGLDLSVPMKNSGVDWIGDIPKHWIQTSFKHGISRLVDFESNGSFEKLKNHVNLDGKDRFAWYVRATDLENNHIGLKNKNVRYCDKSTYDYLSKTKLFGDELLITKRGEIGKVYFVPKLDELATLGPNTYLIDTNKKIITKFAYYYFLCHSGQIELKLSDKSTTIGAIYKDDLRDCRCLFPPICEQKNIVKFLENNLSKFDMLFKKLITKSQKLQEFRQSLILSTVTGKIDVRGTVE